MRGITRWAVSALVLACAFAATAEELTPEATVKAYLSALKAGDFKAAYPYVSKEMAQSKSQEEWAKEMQFVMQMTEAKIFEFKVYPGKTEQDKAYVPNLLSSQDKYLNQLGVEEHELYTLIREDGRWKINQQQIVERSDLSKWFPPEVAGQPK
jgi:hypothetical protein